MKMAIVYIGAAVAEIAGCFAFWGWLRLGRPAWWLLPGVLSLMVFAYLLTLVETEAAGRAYATYGGIYIVASLAWLWVVEGTRPDRWDITGACVCLVGAAVILWGRAGKFGDLVPSKPYTPKVAYRHSSDLRRCPV